MILSLWRYAHLALAVCTSLFLILASVTGGILAVDAIGERVSPYRVYDAGEVPLTQALAVLQAEYPEIHAISVDHNQFVRLQGVDARGDDVDVYVDPHTGAVLGQPEKKTAFIQWITGFHRSLFLHETGRLFVGVVAFLLMLITLSGLVLLIQRQGIRGFFSRVVKDGFAQYGHVVTGRLAWLPIFIIALTGTYLSLARFNVFPAPVSPVVNLDDLDNVPEQRVDVSAFSILKDLRLADLQKIEFPFSDDPEDYFTVRLNDGEMLIDQFQGTIIGASRDPFTSVLERVSMDVHTGRTSIVWAVILALACINILFFIYSGFAITLRRRGTTVKNKYKPSDSEYILLVGSENGSTLRFADVVHQQLLSLGHTSYLAEMNRYTTFPKARHLVIFTSTHGVGEAPSNADRFATLLKAYPQTQAVSTSVVGFGSQSYKDFCGYAHAIDDVLECQPWAKPLLAVHTVDNKSSEQFTHWVKAWSDKSALPLKTTAALYQQAPARLQKMTVVERTVLNEDDQTFRIVFRPRFIKAFTSGDLLAVYPAQDERERLYSIGRVGDTIQLVVKVYPNGLGSGYLNSLAIGTVIDARIVKNAAFHFPAKSSATVMICNGTGIAPFLGMIRQNTQRSEIYMYGGFRKETGGVQSYQRDLGALADQRRLTRFRFAFSREAQAQYVMDLIREDGGFFVDLLRSGGVVMICGSLAMQQDVLLTLDTILRERTDKNMAWFRSNGQLRTDCY